uniref:DNA-directed RNA polymerase subunit beta n=1 Tax=Anthurium amnicola TaxID=1678845 RepID=A0A1D1Y2R9_9ARAE
MESLPDVYPITCLQIGDIQCYLSWAFLYFAPTSKRLLIFVDHRPWSMKKHSRSTKLWQLMITKYRMSPFINTRTLLKHPDQTKCNEKNSCSRSNVAVPKKFQRWYAVIDAAKWQKKHMLSVLDLTKAIHGLLVFEVAWKDVYGINYMNELQTDTSLALEVKFMKKWEFNGPDEASRCISWWFKGTEPETRTLKHNLRKLCDPDVNNWTSCCSAWESSAQTLSGVLSKDTFYDAQEYPFEIDDCELNIPANRECTAHGDQTSMPQGYVNIEESDTIPTQYTYSFILFRFSDAILPFKMRKIIMSDLRLLRLLESGLPSWVIFFQSYPIFCHFYRPWMRPLARSLYILISLITFIFGFYDLYKNVPLLKATVARICGPFFEWIEACDMASRIRYLGTMLFLQNFEKAIKWFLMMARTMKPVFAVIAKPFAEPLAEVVEFISPLWNICVETGEMLSSTLLFTIESLYTAFLDFIEVLLWPFELIYSRVFDIAMSVHPILSSIWKSLLVPFQLVVPVVKRAASVVPSLYIILRNVWKEVSGILQLTSFLEVNEGYHEISIWRGLWNDLFSQVFRALRSIINGLSAFFMTCNRHRLSIYNHTRVSLWRLGYVARLTPQKCLCGQRLERHHMEECESCK